MAGALTATIVGTYKNMADAVAAWNAGTDTTPATDSHQLFIEEGQGNTQYKLIKIVKAP